MVGIPVAVRVAIAIGVVVGIGVAGPVTGSVADSVGVADGSVVAAVVVVVAVALVVGMAVAVKSIKIMKIKLEDLKAAFAIVDAVQASTASESSQFVRLKQNASELDLAMAGALWAGSSVPCLVPGGKWTAYVDRRAFKAFLDTTASPEIEFFYSNQLVVRGDQRIEVAPHAAIAGYEAWTPKQAFDLEPWQVVALRTGAKYLPEAAGSEHLEAASFGKKFTIFTDSLFMMTVVEKSKREFFLPAQVARIAAGKIAVDDKGVGAVFANGFCYQPLSAELDRFPKDKIEELVEAAVASPSLAKFKASKVLEVLRVASQFLLDKNETVKVSPGSKNELTVSVDMGTGKFERAFSLASSTAKLKAVEWPAKRLIPWLEYAVGADPDATISYAKQTATSSFHFSAGRDNFLLFADM